MEKLKGLGIYIKALACSIIKGVKINIHFLDSESKDLGYTCRKKNTANIFLNPFHIITKDLDKILQTVFLTGVAVHEIMHQKLTNFVLTESMMRKMPAKLQSLFMDVANIFEDSRIEAFAANYFGGNVLKALMFTIQYIWEKSPEISPEEPVLQQVLGAMIQYGDMAEIKGELSEEAQEVFDLIIPLFNKAIQSKNCSNCLKLAEKTTYILEPYIPEGGYKPMTASMSTSDSEGEDAEGEVDDTKAVKRKKAETKKSVGAKVGKGKKVTSDIKSDAFESDCKPKDEPGDGSASADGSDSDSDAKGLKPSHRDKSSSEEHKEDSEEASKEESEEEAEKESKTSKDSEETATGGKPEEETLEETEDDKGFTEDDLKALSESLDKAIEDAEKAEAKAAAADEASDYDLPLSEVPDKDKFCKKIFHHKQSPAYDAYARLVEKTAKDSYTLAKLIQRYFRNESGGTHKATTGKLNVVRYKDPGYFSPLIFDKKEKEKEHSVAVLLLVDESGSMSGNRISCARIAATMLAEAMARANVPCCIIGHSGDEMMTGSLEFEHYTTFTNSKKERASIANISARYENRDGPAIRWCSKLLRQRSETNKLMIVISDGCPCARNYGGAEGVYDTKAAIRDAKKYHDVVGVVIEASGYAKTTLHTMYAEDFVACDRAEELAEKIGKVIKKKAQNW